MKVILGPYPGLRSKKERKISVRIDDYDTWNLDQNLGLIIYPALVRLKEVKQGSPYVEDSDVPENLRSTNAAPKKSEWNTDEFHHDRWDWVLDEMIWAFSQLNFDWESQYWSGEIDFQFEKIEGTDNSRMIEGPSHTAVFDKEGHRAHSARMTNGFRLFGTYYQGLWD